MRMIWPAPGPPPNPRFETYNAWSGPSAMSVGNVSPVATGTIMPSLVDLHHRAGAQLVGAREARHGHRLERLDLPVPSHHDGEPGRDGERAEVPRKKRPFQAAMAVGTAWPSLTVPSSTRLTVPSGSTFSTFPWLAFTTQNAPFCTAIENQVPSGSNSGEGSATGCAW